MHQHAVADQDLPFPAGDAGAMRGEWAEFNPWQVPMGSKTQAALELCDVLVYRAERPEEAAETVAAALDIAFNGDLAAAILLSQRLIGAKRWVEMIANERRLDRRAAMRTLLENRGDLLLVTGLGSTTWDAAAVGDDDRNFYLWGAMGAAAMVGLGLAIARPDRRVLVVTGDGEMLMGLGALATIGVQRPPNLAIAVFDNGRYGETGMQASHTAERCRAGRDRPCLRVQGDFRHHRRDRAARLRRSDRKTRRPPCLLRLRSVPTSPRAYCRRATVSY